MMSTAISETTICSMALDRIGSQTISDIETDTSVPAQKCRLHYYQTRDALQRAHWWRFNADRAELAQSTTTPDFEYSFEYPLPSDFLALRSIYGDLANRRNNTNYSNHIEGNNILSSEGEMKIRYSKKVTDPTLFDPLFVEVLILKLAIKLYPALAGSGSPKVFNDLQNELQILMRKVVAMDRQEQNKLGRDAEGTWIDSRRYKNGGRIDSRLGS